VRSTRAPRQSSKITSGFRTFLRSWQAGRPRSGVKLYRQQRRKSAATYFSHIYAHLNRTENKTGDLTGLRRRGVLVKFDRCPISLIKHLKPQKCAAPDRRCGLVFTRRLTAEKHNLVLVTRKEKNTSLRNELMLKHEIPYHKSVPDFGHYVGRVDG
jgi:hypothetical protein